MPDQREEFIKLINDAIPKVRMESGNISYNLYEEINNLNSFLIFEEWKSRKFLNKFIANDINQKNEQKIKQISVDQPSFKVYHFQSIDFKRILSVLWELKKNFLVMVCIVKKVTGE